MKSLNSMTLVLQAPAFRWLAFLITLFYVSTAFAQSPAGKRPNILLILADDLGYSDLGCFGSEIRTQNLDSIARDGVTFTQFYNQSRCCPTRAALLTGRYPHQVGIGTMIDGYAKGQRTAADTPAYDDHLSPDSPTIAELLRKAGYRTMMSGKWHLGYRWAEWPVNRGFDHSFTLIGGAMNYYAKGASSERTLLARNGEPYQPPAEGFYSTDAFADQAVEMIQTAAKAPDQPFFMYLAFNAPHWPLQAPDADIAKYAHVYDDGFQVTRQARLKRMIEKHILPDGSTMAPMDRGQAPAWDKMTDAQRSQWARRMEVYAAQIDHMDAAIGRVLATLKSAGVDDNTIVLFLSDNGGAAEDPNRGDANAPVGSADSYRGYARPWASVSNTPWRNHKVTSFEGGISTPLLVRWPAGIPKSAVGTFIRTPGHVLDLMPTLLEYAKATYAGPADVKPEGRSLAKQFAGEADSTERVFCWEHEGNRAIRAGQWKLVMLAGEAQWHLYDIETDRLESNDLASTQPDVVQRLSKQYDDWAKRVGVIVWPELKARMNNAAASKPN